MSDLTPIAWSIPSAPSAELNGKSSFRWKNIAIDSRTVLSHTAVLAFTLIFALAPFANTATEPLAIAALGLFASLGVISFGSGARAVLIESHTVSPRAILAMPCALFVHSAIMSGQSLLFGSPLGSVAPMDSILEMVRLFALVFTFLWVGWTAKEMGRRYPILVALLVIVLAHAASSLVWHDPQRGTLTGPFANRNGYASFLGLGLVIATSLAVTARRWRGGGVARTLRLVGLWLAIATLFAALALTESRMGLTAAALGIATVLLYRRAWHEAVLVVGIFVTIGLVLGQQLFLRIAFLPEDLDIRLVLYRQIIELIAQRPFTGFGAGSFPLAFESIHHAPLPAEFVWDRAHSSYLSMWVENGLIFGSLPLIAVAVLVVALWRTRSMSRSGVSQSAPSIALGSLVICASHSVFDFSFELLANQILLVSLVSIGLCRARRAEQKLEV